MPITATEVEIKFRPTPYNILELSNAAGGQICGFGPGRRLRSA